MFVLETNDKISEILSRRLRAVLVQRQTKNPHYSVRSFARSLEVDQSLLTKLLKGKRSFSKKLANLVAAKLGFSPNEVNRDFRHSFNNAHFRELEESEYQLLSDWSHIAILELAKIHILGDDPAFIARRLGIHVERVRGALLVLAKLGFIRVEKGRICLLSKNHTWSKSEFTTEARRQLQRSLLERAIESLDGDSFEIRDHSSLTLAIDSSRIMKFKERLSEVREQLGCEFQAQGNLNEVYQITISLFPITRAQTLRSTNKSQPLKVKERK